MKSSPVWLSLLVALSGAAFHPFLQSQVVSGCDISTSLSASAEPPSTAELDIGVAGSKLVSGRLTSMDNRRWNPAEGEKGVVVSVEMPCAVVFRQSDFSVSVAGGGDPQVFASSGHVRTGSTSWVLRDADYGWLVRGRGDGRLHLDLLFAVPAGVEEITLMYQGTPSGEAFSVESSK